MSINRNRKKYNQSKNNRQYNIITILLIWPPYYDECLNYSKPFNRGFKNPNKFLIVFKVRRYKNWKHNRKNQYKPK